MAQIIEEWSRVDGERVGRAISRFLFLIQRLRLDTTNRLFHVFHRRGIVTIRAARRAYTC